MIFAICINHCKKYYKKFNYLVFGYRPQTKYKRKYGSMEVWTETILDKLTPQNC